MFYSASQANFQAWETSVAALSRAFCCILDRRLLLAKGFVPNSSIWVAFGRLSVLCQGSAGKVEKKASHHCFTFSAHWQRNKVITEENWLRVYVYRSLIWSLEVHFGPMRAVPFKHLDRRQRQSLLKFTTEVKHYHNGGNLFIQFILSLTFCPLL